MDARMLPHRATIPGRTRRWVLAAALLGLVLVAATVSMAAPVLAQGDGPHMLHLPMRWCVLDGSVASRNADAAVLERIRRASSILAARTGITLRSPINRSLGESLGFPVIKDPNRRLGRPGDVRTPVESSVEYHQVIATCEQAWQRTERLAGKQADFGGLAKGPVGVIIRDFVNGSGAPVGNVWGYALSASSNSDYCIAQTAPVRWASGGSLMVVDSRDGHPSQLLDRRLVAHEIGHILRLGHGDGLDNPGSIPGRIDKYCDATENPDQPGSLMTLTLSYENVEPWQQRLPRHVVAEHPAGVGTLPFLQPRQKQERVRQLQRIANDGRRVIRRLVPPTRQPLAPLPRLWSAGAWGDDFADRPRDVRTDDGKLAPQVADLQRITVGIDGESGELGLSLSPGRIPVVGRQLSAIVIDVDADATTGGSPSTIPGTPLPGLGGVKGVEFASLTTSVDGEITTRAWLWDETLQVWQEMLPPPPVEVNGHISEDDHARQAGTGEDDTAAKPRPDTLVLTIPEGLIEPGANFRIAAILRTRTPNGKIYVDTIPARPADGLVSMSTRDVDYPVCAVNRDTDAPGTAELGETVTVEVDGFGQDGELSVWLGDGDEPIGKMQYWEPPCDWPWVGEVTLPSELISPEEADASVVPGADAPEELQSPIPEASPEAGETAQPDASALPEDSEGVEAETEGSSDGLYMLQVVLKGTGLTADCPVIIGDPDLPQWFTEDPDEATEVDPAAEEGSVDEPGEAAAASPAASDQPSAEDPTAP